MNNEYIYGVTFKDKGKIYYFKSTFMCPINVTVIVETEKGLEFGRVVQDLTGNDNIDTNNLRNIIRISTHNDYNAYLKNLKDAKKALEECRRLATEFNLPMNIIDCSYTFDRKQLIFTFTADDRIDFRELVRKLASMYHTRIELHQIGARDKAREVGGIGSCGRPLCCASFLDHIDTISMNTVKNQGLAINPSKINGLCGRLLCCLTYEEDEYLRCSKGMPNIGDTITTTVDGNEVTGPVISRSVLDRSYKVLVNNEKVEINLGDPDESSK